eukprot:2421329-Pleurochrysis_carterae.AAC.1
MPSHRRDTRPPAQLNRDAGRQPPRSESRNLANWKPINPWKELSADVRVELERRGMKSGDDPRYLDRFPPPASLVDGKLTQWAGVPTSGFKCRARAYRRSGCSVDRLR